MSTRHLDALMAPKLHDELIALRRTLHKHPELSFQERQTADRLEAELERLVPGVVQRVAGTGLVARIAGRDRTAPLVAVRGDIDALPIHEETDAPFSSEVDGVMHACGHDVHAAWTIGAAHLLAANPAMGDTLILLQPAEETGRGAPAVLESGVLDDVAMIFGAHVDMRFAVGDVVAQAGPAAGSTDEFTIEILGRGAHAARPHEAADPIVAAAAVISALQQIVARRLTPGEPGVVTVSMVRAGTARNVIPERAELHGTMRAVQPSTRRVLQDELRATAQATAEAHGTHAIITIDPGLPPIVNPPDTVAIARDAAAAILGAEALVDLPALNLGGEDFACYMERIPGCFTRIGGRAPEAEPIPAHSPRFLPDDRAVVVGAAVLAETARRASAKLAEEDGVERRKTEEDGGKRRTTGEDGRRE